MDRKRPVTASEALIGYLNAVGGLDRIECFDGAGGPDPLAARQLAEDLRGRAGAALGGTVLIEQVSHRVTVRLVTDAHAVV
jgi:hypothetical protein